MKSILQHAIGLGFFLFFIWTNSFCQVPEAINYQAIARDNNGNPLSNQLVSFRISILTGSPTGMIVYSETHSKTTNQFGLATLEIGRGTVVSGNFSTIDWGNETFFLKTEMDPAGGTSFSLSGTSQFLSVPFSMYSKTSGNALPAGTSGQTLRYDGNTWIPNSTLYNEGTQVGVGTGNPENSAILDVHSVNKGFLPPRMTGAEMVAIPDPAEGLMVFCTDCGENGSGIFCVFAGGSWKIFTLGSCILTPPGEGQHVAGSTSIVWHWHTVTGATGYKWNTTNDYGSAINMDTATSMTENGLTCNTIYTRYVWSYSSCGKSTPTTLTKATIVILPETPAPRPNEPSPTHITWNWNPVTGAIGYRWNTTNDYASSIDTHTAVSKYETGLTCNTEYTRYAWAYNSCGNSTPLTMTQTTSLDPPAAPDSGTNVPSITQIIWNWMPVANATGYKWNTTNNFTTAADLGNSTTKTETGLICNTPYARYVWAYSNCGTSDSLIMNQSTSLNPPPVPTAGTHVPSQTQIIWNWNTAAGATGYKWNTTNNYSTATDMGTATTKTETGLVCNTSYTRYVWAYSACGYSSAATLTQNSSPCLPIVTTTSITGITQTTATGGGTVTSDGGGTVTGRGVCWSTSTNPTIAGSHTSDGSGTGVFTSTLQPLLANTPYYVRAYATNVSGTAYGNQVTFTTVAFAIGQSYGGGIIFYIDGTNQHGLISATTDQSSSSQWGCNGTVIGGTSTAIGHGQANTTAIVNGCATAGIAARICDNLVLNSYSDWFLPSKDELNQMYLHKTAIGSFVNNQYWSSSENGDTSGWAQNFNDGYQGYYFKYNTYYVRAVRAF